MLTLYKNDPITVVGYDSDYGSVHIEIFNGEQLLAGALFASYEEFQEYAADVSAFVCAYADGRYDEFDAVFIRFVGEL